MNSGQIAAMEEASERANNVLKELIGGGSDGETLLITSNVITPTSGACVFPVDTTGGSIINLINVSNYRDGQVLFLHCVSSSNPVTIVNLAKGSGLNMAIATASGANSVLDNPDVFISLKYSEELNLFQEICLWQPD